MVERPEFVRIPTEGQGHAVIRFVTAVAKSRLCHVESSIHPVMQDCQGNDCLHCLAASRAMQRFTFRVYSEGVEKLIDIPLTPYRMILDWKKQLGTTAFMGTDFTIGKVGQGLGTSYVIRPVSGPKPQLHFRARV